jgi:hypothetical protein
MPIWVFEYFERGAPTAYLRQTLVGAEARNAAVLQFLRLGGDDLLKITPWHTACLRLFTGLVRRIKRREP